MTGHKTRREKRRSARVRIAFDRTHIDVARRALEKSGSPAGAGDDDAALAVFTIGLGVLTGHYNELLATRLREVHLRAFGPDGPARFREAAMALHGSATMPEIAAALLDGTIPGAAGENPPIQ